MIEEKVLVVKMGKGVDRKLGFNGIVYIPEIVDSAKLKKGPWSRYDLNQLNRFDKAYPVAATVSLATKLEPCDIIGELMVRHGCVFHYGGYALAIFDTYCAPIPEIVKDLNEHPQNYYSTPLMDFLDTNPEVAKRLRGADDLVAHCKEHRGEPKMEEFLQIFAHDLNIYTDRRGTTRFDPESKCVVPDLTKYGQ